MQLKLYKVYRYFADTQLPGDIQGYIMAEHSLEACDKMATRDKRPELNDESTYSAEPAEGMYGTRHGIAENLKWLKKEQKMIKTLQDQLATIKKELPAEEKPDETISADEFVKRLQGKAKKKKK